MKCENYVKLSFPALSRNESYARAAVGAFVSQLDPTVDELGSVKAAVSEAVTNCVVHAYSECETVGIIKYNRPYKRRRSIHKDNRQGLWHRRCEKGDGTAVYNKA